MMALGSCSSEPLQTVVEFAEQSAVAEAAAGATQTEIAELRTEIEATQAGGALDAVELEDLAGA